MKLIGVLAVALLATAAQAAPALKSVAIGSQPSAGELKMLFGIQAFSEVGSSKRMDECSPLAGTSFMNRKWKECMNAGPAVQFPLPAGVYMSEPGSMVRVWDALVTTFVTIDQDGRVAKIIVDYQSGYFPQLSTQAVALWGHPETSAAPAQNLYGARITVVEQDWSFPDGTKASLLSNYDMTRGHLTLSR